MRVITRLLARRLLGPVILGLAAVGASALPAGHARTAAGSTVPALSSRPSMAATC
jgi:hypothetical protein